MMKRISLSLIFFITTFHLFGQETDERIIHQPDSLLVTNDYTIYKADTFNVRDNKGMIQGKGILIIKDKKVVQGMTSYTMGHKNGSKIATCEYHEAPTHVYNTVREVFYGQFQDNLMIGVWTCFWGNGKRRVELTYDKGIIQGPVNIYFDTGELKYGGTAIAGQDEIELKKFTKDGQQTEIIYWWLSDIIPK